MQRPRPTRLSQCLLLAMAMLACAGLISIADGYIARNWQYQNLPGELRRIVTWSEIFAHGFGIAAIIIGIYILAPRLRRYLPRLIACPLFAGLAATGIKYFVDRTRPMAMYHLLDSTIGNWSVGWNQELAGRMSKINYNFQSFPSGHAATAFGFAIGLSWLLPRGRWYFFAMAALSGLQRSVSLAHWASDVFAGAAVGIVVAGIVTGTKWCDRFYGIFENPSEAKLPDLLNIETTGIPDRRAA